MKYECNFIRQPRDFYYSVLWYFLAKLLEKFNLVQLNQILENVRFLYILMNFR